MLRRGIELRAEYWVVEEWSECSVTLPSKRRLWVLGGIFLIKEVK